MKKIVLISAIIISLIILISSSVYAKELTVSTDINKTELEDNKIKVEITITGLKNLGDGINAYSGVLNFDEEVLELIEVKAENEWNPPAYNEKTLEDGKTKIVATANKFIKEDSSLFSAIFKKKVEKKENNIEFIEFEAAAKVNGETVKVKEINNEIIEETEVIEKENIEQSKSSNNIWGIVGLVTAAIILLIGILFIAFGNYRKKGGK